MLYGLLDLSLKGYLITGLIFTQISIVCVTIFLHRHQTHQALTLHPIASHFFRFWLWLATGIKTKEWVAIHRKHHAKCETAEDPHSPMFLGLKKILLQGAEVYRVAKTPETIEYYGHGTPDDWLERHLYSAHDRLGVCLMLMINLILFGIPGLTLWAIQMLWIPFFGAGVVNGIGHYFGYRNFEPKDTSTNIIPIGLFIGGEELHNNHHTFPSSAKFSVKWWEFDMGWVYIQILQFFNLAKVKRSIPKLSQKISKSQLDIESLKVIINHRLQILSEYSQKVIFPVLLMERKKIEKHSVAPNAIKKLLISSELLLDERMKKQISLILKENAILRCVYDYRIQLQKIWEKTTATPQELLEALTEWCQAAERVDIPFLRDFAKKLPQYSI